MLTIFNRQSLWTGTDMKRFNQIRDELDAGKIKYTYTTNNRMGQWAGPGKGTLRGRIGSIGMPTEQMYEYEIFVHKDEYEIAKQALANTLGKE